MFAVRFRPVCFRCPRSATAGGGGGRRNHRRPSVDLLFPRRRSSAGAFVGSRRPGTPPTPAPPRSAAQRGYRSPCFPNRDLAGKSSYNAALVSPRADPVPLMTPLPRRLSCNAAPRSVAHALPLTDYFERPLIDGSAAGARCESRSPSVVTASSAACGSPVSVSRMDRPRFLLAWLRRWFRNVRRTGCLVFRSVEIVVHLSPLLFLVPASSDLAWRYTLFALQNLGPAFVKLGQWAAARRDIFPAAACDRLSELHNAARTHGAGHTRRELAEAFGEDYEARGLILDGGSCDDGRGGSGAGAGGVIGSGSVAQVHRGTLTIQPRQRGRVGEVNGSAASVDVERRRTVAIKVLHPVARALVERDLELMEHAAALIDGCLPFEAVRMMSLPRAVSNFADVMRRQVDLRIEGENLMQFRKNFGCLEDNGDEWDDESRGNFWAKKRKRQVQRRHQHRSTLGVEFPGPVKGWVSERVLVEDHAGDNAFPVSRYLADDSPAGLEKRRKLAGPLIRAFLKMVFVDNFVHGDLHPGNVLVKELRSEDSGDGTHDGQSEFTIVFLDAGIAASLSPNDRKNLRDLFMAVVLNDGYKAGSLMVERARYERCTSVPGGKHAFATSVGDIVAEFHDRRKRGLTLGAVKIGSLLAHVLDLCRVHGVEIDPAMASVVVSTLVLEGLGRSLDSEMNLIDCAIPFILGRGWNE